MTQKSGILTLIWRSVVHFSDALNTSFMKKHLKESFSAKQDPKSPSYASAAWPDPREPRKSWHISNFPSESATRLLRCRDECRQRESCCVRVQGEEERGKKRVVTWERQNVHVEPSFVLVNESGFEKYSPAELFLPEKTEHARFCHLHRDSCSFKSDKKLNVRQM